MTFELTNVVQRRAVHNALGKLLRPPSFEGLQVFGGRMAKAVTLSGSGNTYEFATELMARDVNSVGYIRAIAAASYASGARTSCFVNAKMLASLADADSSFATSMTWTDGEQVAQSVFPTSASRRNYIFSDPLEVTPVARTDSGTRPLAGLRAWFGSGQTLALLGNDSGTDDYTNWPTRPEGLARFRSNGTVGDQRTNASGWSTVSTGPLVGVAFGHLGRVVNVMSIGDSIDEGRGTYIGASFGRRACEIINEGSYDATFVHSNLAWSGQNTSNMVRHLRDIVRDGIIPDILIFPAFSPNDPGNATITSAQIDLMRSRVAQMLALCTRFNITPVVRTGLPCNTAVNNWGSSDSLRVAYNSEIVSTLGAAGVTVVDIGALFNGATSGGQVQMNPDLEDDGIHPNDAGIEAGANLLAPALQDIVGGYL